MMLRFLIVLLPLFTESYKFFDSKVNGEKIEPELNDVKYSGIPDYEYQNPKSFDADAFPLYEPKNVLPFVPWSGGCQKACAHVKNKALVGMMTSDVGLIAQAYITAKTGMETNKKSLQKSLMGIAQYIYLTFNPNFLGQSCIGKGITNYLIQFHYKFLLLLNYNVHIPNYIDYRRVRDQSREFLTRLLGEEAVDELDHIKYYRVQSTQFNEWLEKQKKNVFERKLACSLSSGPQSHPVELNDGDNNLKRLLNGRFPGIKLIKKA